MKHKFLERKASKSFKEQHEVLGGECVVYRTKQNGQVWQFRCWISEEKKYVRVSLKTRDLSTAREKAKQHYFDIQHQLRSGVKVFGITWRELVDAYLSEQQQRVVTKKITAGRFVTIKSQLTHLLAFVGGGEIKVSEIGKGKFRDYAQYRRLKNIGVRDVTIRNEHATINSLIKFGHRKGYLAYQSGEFEEIRIRGDDIGKRETFTIEEYRTLYVAMRRWVTEKCAEREKGERQTIRDFILISAQSFARFGELRQLRWRDVQVFSHQEADGRENRMAFITVRGETSKVRRTRKVSCRAGEYFTRLRRFSKHTKDDDFVFCDQETGKILDKKTYYRLWHDLLGKAKLSDARHLSYYALRHFGITMRLYAGVSFEDLSALAGTSFTHIKNHYSHVDNTKLLAAAMKRFSIDKNGFVVRE